MDMRSRVFIVAILTALAFLLAGNPVSTRASLNPAAPHAPLGPLPQPDNIACQGWERDTVQVSWRDTATDETNYRVERSIGGAAWTQVATISPDSDGKYAAYRDTGADVSTQNRRYRVRSFRSSDNSFSPYSEICNNRHIYDPGAFRLFYGLRGTSDDCPLIDGHQVCLADTNNGSGNNVFVVRENTALNGSVAAFGRAGFTRDASAPPGGLDKIPINVVWCDGGGCAGGSSLGLSPSLIETPFNLTTRAGDPVAWLVALHELFHFQQFKYGGLDDPAGKWVVEGQARSIQDKFCIGANRSTAQCFDDIDTGDGGYVPEVKGYLGSPNWPVNQKSYQAALFWTYVTEKFGTNAPSDPVEAGTNVLEKFWSESAANPGRDGIAVLNSTLADMGYSQRFRDIWKDFAVANYAKDLTGSVPAKYKYADMSQPGGNYGPVALALDRTLNLNESATSTDNTVQSWGANYYQFKPASNVPVIDIKFSQDSSFNVYYTILGIKGNDIAYEYNVESRDLVQTLVNDGYDKVVVIVAGLEHMANYRYSINGTQPSLHIISPTTGTKARVGDPSTPDKFLVTVEVDGADAKPLAGVNVNNFTFRVGSVDVPTANILTRATIMGQQWFLLRAPVQSAAAQYNLQVSYSGILSDTQSLAVDYTPRIDADNILLIDRSGSMLGDKLAAAKTAAHLYVDSWRVGDKIGVTSFNGAPSNPPDMGLTNWTDSPSGGSRATAFNAIDSLVAGGSTAIGDALRSGWNQLISAGNNSHDWALILLSDGKEEGTVNESFDKLIGDLKNATGKRPAVYAVAVGPDADRPRMQRVADVTGGTYQYVSIPATAMPTSGPGQPAQANPGGTGEGFLGSPSSPAGDTAANAANAPLATNSLQLNMDARYRMIATKVAGQQQFYSLNGPVNDGNPISDSLTIPVEGSASELVLSLSWDTSSGLIGSVQLRDPNGATVAPFETDNRHYVWRVSTPQPGNWNLYIETVIITAPQGGNSPQVEYLPEYLVQSAVKSKVTMDVYLANPDNDRTPGAAMQIVAGLTDTGPITGASVKAQVEKPNGLFSTVTLYDDGAHGDGAANDGIYSNKFTQTGLPGSYNVTVNATGTSPISGAFTRQELLSFHLDSAGDRDGDGLPDEWEIRFGTNPDVPDANADPDADGVPTIVEWGNGTDPLNPDTDNGGEGDATDPNPNDPSDDRIQPPYGVAYAGIGKVHVKYTLRPGYSYVGFFRSDNPNGPFTFHQQLTPGTGIYTDTVVTNGQQYCYILEAIGASGARSGSSAPTCATPNSDPWPPHGGILINGDARVTLIPDVRLSLWATDAVDPETVIPGDEILLPPPDSASGVTEMMISNYADMHDGTWEPYATSKAWTLGQSSGLASVFVKYRDADGNESDVYSATIHVGHGPGESLYLPVIHK
jgi:Mg-chelatase subunit ChlD